MNSNQKQRLIKLASKVTMKKLVDEVLEELGTDRNDGAWFTAEGGWDYVEEWQEAYLEDIEEAVGKILVKHNLAKEEEVEDIYDYPKVEKIFDEILGKLNKIAESFGLEP